MTSISVHKTHTRNICIDKEKVYKMMRHHRIRYYAPADYSNGSKLDTLVKQIIRKTAAYEVLEGEYIHCKYEAEE